MVKGLDALRQTNHSIILSAEAMSQGAKRFMYQKNDQGLLKLSLFAKELQARWNVKIVIVCRRYFEWILSAFKEANSKTAHFQIGK
jgi:mitochondrial fission protein ELM1